MKISKYLESISEEKNIEIYQHVSKIRYAMGTKKKIMRSKAWKTMLNNENVFSVRRAADSVIITFL
ncbi:MAG: hypothetical protein ACLTJB_03250 [Holdemania filiformis]